MTANDPDCLQRRRDVLASLRGSRALFLELGNSYQAEHLEQGIFLLLDHHVSPVMIERMAAGAAIAARLAICIEHHLKIAQSLADPVRR